MPRGQIRRRVLHTADRLTRTWVRATGRRVELPAGHWLDGPSGDAPEIGDAWLTRLAAGRTPRAGGGLLPSMAALDGPGFAAADLHTQVRAFYEHTAGWRLDLWSQWSVVAWPGGWLISTLFARRLGQLGLPLRPLEVAHGMTSEVTTFPAANGRPSGTVWTRRLRATGRTVYAGWYGTAVRPDADRPSVRVVFPLPAGRLVVLLRPDVTADGGLLLSSGTGRWGEDAAYFVVHRAGRRHGWARPVPLRERFHVYVDGDGELRTDHELRLGVLPVLRLHYRLVPDGPHEKMSVR